MRAALLALLIVGCTAPPISEMSDAEYQEWVRVEAEAPEGAEWLTEEEIVEHVFASDSEEHATYEVVLVGSPVTVILIPAISATVYGLSTTDFGMSGSVFEDWFEGFSMTTTGGEE